MRRIILATMFLLGAAMVPQAVAAPSAAEVAAPGEEAEKAPDPAAAAGEADTKASPTKQAFDEAKALGTADAWNAFLTNYPNGFYTALARGYLKKLGAASPASELQAAPPAGELSPTDPTRAAVSRGAGFIGFPERFNRYYTDPAWRPSKVVYVSQDGNGDGATREAPMAAQAAVAAARPGTGIIFTRGAYTGGFEFTKETSGTYDEPVVVYAERNEDGSIGVKVDCSGSRETCFNLEAADYVAVDGFELVGGRYGVRAVGADYAASGHSRGVLAINCYGHDQDRDPFFSGQADWAIWERNIATGAGKGDGHGIYLSNGGDWNIVRYNETFSNLSSDFQINADPNATCKEVGIAFTDARCDDYAGTGEGGQGASDYFLVDANYFHHGTSSGPNFTSVRRSVVRNNVFAIYPKHNVSFWQETDNPKLGSSDNRIVHNLFVTSGRQAIQFVVHSTRNVFANNVLLGVSMDSGQVAANPSAVLMEVDATVGANTYRSNLYAGGKLDGRTVDGDETATADLSADWFARFPLALNHDANDFAPTAKAPFLNRGALSSDASADRNGTPRGAEADLGPIEVP